MSSVGLAHVSHDEFSFTFSFSVRGVSRVTSAFGCVSVEWSSTESSSVVLSACLSPDVSSVSASGAVVSGVEGTCSLAEGSDASYTDPFASIVVLSTVSTGSEAST